ncbi:MAG: trigger factor [bacterium]|nr:trigger factor [bacterium]
MKVNLEKKDKNLVELVVEVDADRVNRAYEHAARDLAKQVRIDGFRPGKAPLKLVERHVGSEAILAQAIEKQLVGEAYTQAITEHQVETIADPNFELVSFGKGEALVFKATVEVRPEVKLGTYTDIEVTAVEVSVTDEDVQNQLNSLASSRGSLETADRAAAMGDVVIADFEGKIGGEAFAGGTATGYSIEMATGRFIEGFVEGLVGTTAGQEPSLDLKFPEDYPNQELAGKDVTFTFKVHEVKERKAPTLDDAFATSLGSDSLEALTARIREDLTAQRSEAREVELRKQMLEKILGEAEMEIPETMIRREIDLLITQQARMLQQQGIDPNQIFTRENIDSWRTRVQPEAEKRIRTSLTLGAIARAENIQPTVDEIEEAIVEFAAESGTNPKSFRNQVIRNGAWNQIADEVLSSKIVEWLFEKAKIVEKSAELVEA